MPISIELLNSLPRINEIRFNRDGTSLVWSESVGAQGVIFEGKQEEMPVGFQVIKMRAGAWVMAAVILM